ncbi:hypothetical protein LAZ67_2003293, partial [Cordylochernes scorpioides]
MPRRKIRAHYEHMSKFETGRVIGLKEAGWSNRLIARHLCRSDAAIRRCWQEWVNNGSMQRQDGSGREERREERAFVRIAVAAPESTLSTIERVTGTQVSKMTINRRKRERNLRARRPLRCLPLTPVHRQVRLQWCRERSTWNCADWGRIVFSDDSRFLLCPGQRVDPGLTVEHHTGPQQGVMVWDAILFDSRTSLAVIPGTLTAQRYVDDILRPVLLPFLSHHPGLTFQQDSARPHTARVTMDCLQSCRTLPWPARSPDLSLIEHIWEVMGRRLQPFRNIDYLARQLETIWQEIPQHTIRNLYQSMTRRRMPGHRKRRQFKQTDAFTRSMVIGLERAGWSIRQIAADTHLGASTVHRLWRRWLEQGNVAIYRNVGATRVTSARVDRRILRQAVAAPQATCTAILQHVQDTLDHSISTRTISRRLVANGLHSCRPLRRLPLTPPNRRQGLEWCRARSTWMTEWHRVVFSDESRFCLSSDSRRVRVWRRRGERSNPAAIVERPTVRQRGIMVWGAIAYDSRSPLLRIQGTMMAQRYVDDVLRPVTLPYLQGVPNALYQQDNARPHTARISQQALQDVQMLPWPPYSPDLSPIEHVWDIIGRPLHALPQPCSEDELWQMVEREWRAIRQDAIRTLIDSLPRRVAACIAVR